VTIIKRIVRGAWFGLRLSLAIFYIGCYITGVAMSFRAVWGTQVAIPILGHLVLLLVPFVVAIFGLAILAALIGMLFPSITR
jgi:hypothetical protein